MDIDERLIKEVRKHACVYDFSCEDYKVLRYKSYAWEEIGRRCNLGEAECRKRWRVMRDYYKRSKRADREASGKKPWKYAKLMTFLDKVPSGRKHYVFSNEVLIKEVQKHPCLYDSQVEEYKYLDAKNRAWEMISQSLRLDELQCRRKWRVLRDCYKRYSKLQKNGKEIKWKYTKMLSFLDDDPNFRQHNTVDHVDNAQSFTPVVDNVPEETCSEAEGDSIAEFIKFSPQGSPDPDPLSAVQSAVRSNSSLHLQDEEPIQNKFQELLDSVAENIKQTCDKIESEERSSTATYFASLALKIKEANLPMSEILSLETEVSAIVYQRIQNYLQRRLHCEEFVRL